MNSSVRGKFVTVEGTEGVGKSTNMAFVESWLRQQGHELVVTREPGGTPLAEEIRDLLLRLREEAVDSTAELLLMFAARAQHLSTLIEPALAAGHWVLCDRFTDATYAYQGGGRHLDQNTIATLETLVQGSRQPDLTLFLDIDVSQGLQRAKERGDLDRFEEEDVSFFERVRSVYLQRVQDQPERFAVVDAGQSLDRVQADIQRILEQRLQR